MTHNQYQVWTTRLGKRIHLDDMTEDHAKSIISLALRQRFKGRFVRSIRRLQRSQP